MLITPSMYLPDLDGKYPICGFSNIEVKRVVWELISACNRTCYYCFATPEYDHYRKAHLKKLSLSAIFEAGRKLKILGYTDIQLSGGELFLRNDTLEILQGLDNLGFTMALSSNCDFLTDDVIKRILKLNIRSLNVSLDSHIPEVNDAVRGEGAFQNTVKAIKCLVGESIRLRVHTVITNHNRAHVDQVSDFLYHLGARLHTISSELPFVESYEPDLANRLIQVQNRHPDMEIVLLRIKLSLTQGAHEWAACSRGSNLIGIYSDGTITPCTLYLGSKPISPNIYRDDLLTIKQALEKLDQVGKSIKGTPCILPDSFRSAHITLFDNVEREKKV